MIEELLKMRNEVIKNKTFLEAKLEVIDELIKIEESKSVEENTENI